MLNTETRYRLARTYSPSGAPLDRPSGSTGWSLTRRLALLIVLLTLPGLVSVGLVQARSLVVRDRPGGGPLLSPFGRGPIAGVPGSPTPSSGGSESLDDPFSSPAAVALGALPRVLLGSLPQDSAVDPTTHTVYATNSGLFGPSAADASVNTLSVVDARSCNARDPRGCAQSAATVDAGNGPFGIAIDEATHTIYVADANTDTVSVIDAATCNAQVRWGCDQTRATITVGADPAGVTVDPRTDSVYVADAGPGFVGSGPSGDTVSVIDGATCNADTHWGCDQTPATVPVGSLPFGVAVDPASHTVYVTNANDNTVSMIDTRTCRTGDLAGCGTPPQTAAAGEFPVAAVVDPRSGTVYLADNGAPTVSLLDGGTCNATTTAGCLTDPQTLSTPGGPDGLSIDPATDTLFVANNGPGPSTRRADSVSIVPAWSCDNQASWGCDRTWPTVLTGASPGGPTFDQTTGTLYITTFDNALQVIDPRTCNGLLLTGCGQAVPATIAGTDPFSIVTNPATDTVYVGDSGGSEGFPFGISVINAATCNPDDQAGCATNPPLIPMQGNPYRIAVDPTTDTLYATNLADNNGNPGNTLSVIDAATCNATVQTGCADTPVSVTVGNGPAGVAVDPATHTIYVANSNDNTVSVIDGSHRHASDYSTCGQTSPVIQLPNSPNGPWAVAINPSTDTVYALNPGTPATISVIDGATCNSSTQTACAVLATISLGNDSAPMVGLAVNENTDTLYAVNNADDTVSVINGATCNGTDILGCGEGRSTSASAAKASPSSVDPTANLVYVSDMLDDTVSVINGATCDAVTTSGCDHIPATVPTGANPSGVTIDPDNETLYATDNGGGVVSYFRFQTPGAPTDITARISGARATVRWQAPPDGGLPITYTVTPTPACPRCRGLTTPTTSGLPHTTITGLTPARSGHLIAGGTRAAPTRPFQQSR